MNEEYLYLQIASAIRRDIANGLYKPGDTLPTVRSYSKTWHCTIGTVQRAIQKLVSQGILDTHIGKGTRVIAALDAEPADPIRQANILHRAESFLLDTITTGYTTAEAENALKTAIQRWQSYSQPHGAVYERTLRFAGSHDLAVAWMAAHFNEIAPGHQMLMSFSGSLSGLMALAESHCDIAGSHLFDNKTGEYNFPFIKTLLPNEKIAVVTLAQRQLGLIVKPGNPKGIKSIADLSRGDIHYVNRNAGSGTRVYLDYSLKKLNIDPKKIDGYLNQKNNHSEVAAEIANGAADAGLGLEAAAKASHLDFIDVTLERYDLIMKAEKLESEPVKSLVNWLKGEAFHTLLYHLGGYVHTLSGAIRFV